MAAIASVSRIRAAVILLLFTLLQSLYLLAFASTNVGLFSSILFSLVSGVSVCWLFYMGLFLFVFWGWGGSGSSSCSCQVHIVYMGERAYDEPELVQDLHHGILSDVLGRSGPALFCLCTNSYVWC